MLLIFTKIQALSTKSNGKHINLNTVPLVILQNLIICYSKYVERIPALILL